jgi:MHS family proline/betaine transporter-like MFS transporter
MLQGFSAGGEFGSATAYLVEHAPHRRGFFSSWQFASQGLSMLLAALFGAALHVLISSQQFDDWGWRIPFIFGLLIGPAGYYVRQHLGESPEFIACGGAKAPLQDIFSGQKERILIGTGCVVMCTIGVYTILYMPTYAMRQLGISPTQAFGATIAAGAVLVLVTPLIGHWSDTIGRTPFMIIGSALFAFLTYPLFQVLAMHPDFVHLILVQTLLGLFLAIFEAPMPALLSEMFPVHTRSTGMSLSYNIAVMIFGGFAGMTITWLIALTHNKLAICFYVIGGAALSIIATVAARYRLKLK